MASENELSTNRNTNPITKLINNLVYNQIANSLLSKKGKTTLTNVFEGTPQNAVVSRRGFTAPNTSATTTALINKVAKSEAKTYLESLKDKQ